MTTQRFTDRTMRLLTRLGRRYTLEGQRSPGAFVPALSQVVIPIIDIDATLRDPLLKSADLNVGAGAATLYTVPTGKRAIVVGYHKAAAAGTPGLQINDGTNTLRITAGAAAEQEGTGAFVLDESWTWRLSQGAAGDTSINCGIAYVEFDR